LIKNEHQKEKGDLEMQHTNNFRYKHYIAIDWSIKTVEIARMTYQGSEIERRSIESKVRTVKDYLNGLRGSKILTIEETTGSHWLYVELYEHVDKIIICDPYRNRLLSEGPKNDKIDAEKLCILLRSGLLKEVYHSLEHSYNMRKLVKAYEQLVNAGVRVKNQRSAVYRGMGLNHKKDGLNREDKLMEFVELQQQRSIRQYVEEKCNYEKVFEQIRKEQKVIKQLTAISGIGTILAMKIYSIVVDATRFENKYKYWSYCGLVSHMKESGGRNYGRREPRYCRTLKGVYRSAALAAISGNNDIREYYDELIKRSYSPREAANQIARYIAKATYAVMKNKIPYRAYQWRESR
jgi:transposase